MMSVAFLYRLASQVAVGKTAADRASLAKGKPPLPLDEFIVGLMTEQYGMKDLAAAYLCEMFKGLASYRFDSLRLRMFSATTGLFDEPKPMRPSSHTLMLDVIAGVADALDAERALSQCRRDQLYARFGELNELFLPTRYVEKGLESALAHEHPELAAALREKMTALLPGMTLATTKECEQRLATSKLQGVRACVLGKKLQANFVSMDEVLQALVDAHGQFVDQRSTKAARLFAKYDTNGDGVFDRQEFQQMLEQIHPNASADDIEELWRAAGGKGASSTLDMKSLEEKLFSIGRLHKAATIKAPARAKNALVVNAHAQLAREELSVMVALWDSVREAEDLSTAEGKAKAEALNTLMQCKWTTIMRMKIWLRQRLEKWRKAAHANHSPTAEGDAQLRAEVPSAEATTEGDLEEGDTTEGDLVPEEDDDAELEEDDE